MAEDVVIHLAEDAPLERGDGQRRGETNNFFALY
jgi:hypothetical protein